MPEGQMEGPIQAASIKAEINVTPLVDVSLVLLVIFMLVMPMIREGVEVLLPATNKPKALGEDTNQVAVTVRADGTIYLGHQLIALGPLGARVKRIRSEAPDREFVVRGDRRLPYRELRRVMATLSEAGVTSAALITRETDPREATSPEPPG